MVVIVYLSIFIFRNTVIDRTLYKMYHPSSRTMCVSVCVQGIEFYSVLETYTYFYISLMCTSYLDVAQYRNFINVAGKEVQHYTLEINDRDI